MKRILTLMIAFGAIVSATAQSSRSYPSDRNDSRDVFLRQQSERTYGNNSRNNYSFTANERDRQIDRINGDFDVRIRRVERDRRLRSSEKAYQVRRLEEQRRNEVSQVWERFRNSRNSNSDNGYRRNDRRW